MTYEEYNEFINRLNNYGTMKLNYEDYEVIE